MKRIALSPEYDLLPLKMEPVMSALSGGQWLLRERCVWLGDDVIKEDSPHECVAGCAFPTRDSSSDHGNQSNYGNRADSPHSHFCAENAYSHVNFYLLSHFKQTEILRPIFVKHPTQNFTNNRSAILKLIHANRRSDKKNRYLPVHHTGSSFCSWISYSHYPFIFFPFLWRLILVSLL